MRSPKPYSDRFEEFISPEPNSGCWLFDGGWNQRGGYCQIWSNGKRKMAHRFAYEKYRGPIPSGMCVCHKCDVPCCVNPDHLILGTDAENMADKTVKNRQAKGTKIGISKLSPEQVLAIRASVQSCHSLGPQYGVDHSTIQHIRRRKTWKHLL
jgi:hypothetical protein